jgi:hypothetical protein
VNTSPCFTVEGDSSSPADSAGDGSGEGADEGVGEGVGAGEGVGEGVGAGVGVGLAGGDGEAVAVGAAVAVSGRSTLIPAGPLPPFWQASRTLAAARAATASIPLKTIMPR